jgi:uncharacterized protein
MIHEITPHHRFDLDGEPFLFAAASGALVGLDHAAVRVLARFQEHPAAELGELLTGKGTRDAVRDLAALGVLRPLGEVTSVPDALPPMPFPLQSLVLNVASKCNLACTYCYEYGEERPDPKRPDGSKPSSNMTPETAKRSVDLLLEESGGRGAVTVTYFGGETLLNFDVVRSATLHAEERARELGMQVNFSLTTNATLLTPPIVEFLVEHGFGVQVSIDGTPDDHDRHRTYASGRGSYTVVRENVDYLLKHNRAGNGRPIGARVTVTHGFRPIPETLRHLRDELGFDSVGFAPVTSGGDVDHALKESDMDRLLADFRSLADDYVQAAKDGSDLGFSNLGDLLRELHQGANKAHPCGAGLGLLGVSTDGDLHPCHRFVEGGSHSLGTLDDGIDAAKREDLLKRTHVSNKSDCASCFARPHCAGGCYHEAEMRHGDIGSANLHHCDWIRAWTALGLEVHARLTRDAPDFLARFEPRPVVRQSTPTRSTDGGTTQKVNR